MHSKMGVIVFAAQALLTVNAASESTVPSQINFILFTPSFTAFSQRETALFFYLYYFTTFCLY